MCVQCARNRIHFDVFSWKRVFHYSLLFYLLWQPQPTSGNNKNSCFFFTILLHLCIVQSKIGSAVSKMHMRVDVICAATMRYENHYSFWSNHVGHDVHCSLRTFVLPFQERNERNKNATRMSDRLIVLPEGTCKLLHSLLGLPSWMHSFRSTFRGHFLLYYLFRYYYYHQTYLVSKNNRFKNNSENSLSRQTTVDVKHIFEILKAIFHQGQTKRKSKAAIKTNKQKKNVSFFWTSVVSSDGTSRLDVCCFYF